MEPPEWMEAENPDWEGNYKVRNWDEEWQAIVYGGPDSYRQKILDAGFDGAYLDIRATGQTRLSRFSLSASIY